MPNPHADPARLAELLRRKRGVLAQLHQVGLRQGELVNASDATLLLRLLSAKQSLLSALQQVERSLAPFHAQDPDQRQWATPEARAAAAADAAECARLLEAVVQMERRHEQAIAERRDRVAQQLRVAHAAHQAAGAYGMQATRRAPATPSAAGVPDGVDLTSGA